MLNWKIKHLNNVILVFALLMIARFSCVALSKIPFMSMDYMFVYGGILTLLFFLCTRIWKKKEFIAFVFLIIYIIDVFFVTVLSTGELFNTQVFNAYMLFFIFIIYLFLKRLHTRKVKVVYNIAIGGFLFTYIYSIIQLIQNPLLSRKAATGFVDQENVDALGGVIGGFDTVYGSVLLICIFLFVIQQTNSIALKVCAIAIIGISCTFLVMASYATAVVLVILLTMIFLFQKNRIMGFIVIAIVVMLFIFREQVGEVVIEFSKQIESQTWSGKIKDIGTIISTGESAGTWAGEQGRKARILWSWEAFEKYPLTGAFGQKDVKIGEHSEIFDTLGRFGIVGASALFGFLGMLFRDIYQGMCKTDGKKCCIICVVLYVIMMVLNPALYTQQLLPIFILLPFYERMYQNDLYDYNENSVVVGDNYENSNNGCTNH